MKLTTPDLERLEWLNDGSGFVKFGFWVSMEAIVSDEFGMEQLNELAEQHYTEKFVKMDGSGAAPSILSDISYKLACVNTEAGEILIQITTNPEVF